MWYICAVVAVMVYLCCGGCVGVTVLWRVWCICAVVAAMVYVYLCCGGCVGVTVLW